MENREATKTEEHAGIRTPAQVKENREGIAMGKDENIAFRTSSEIKEILERLAKEGYRSLSQQCEMMIVQWLEQNGHLKEKDLRS